MSNRSAHYNVKKRDLREKTTHYNIPEGLFEKLKIVADFDEQPLSRVLESAINFYLRGEKNEEIHKKIQASKKCYKAKKAIFSPKKENKQNRQTCQKTSNLPKLFD